MLKVSSNARSGRCRGETPADHADDRRSLRANTIDDEAPQHERDSISVEECAREEARAGGLPEQMEVGEEAAVVCPSSVRTLAAIAHGSGDHLVHRAADVILKERRKLVLVVREAPLNDIHLENMLKLSRMGAVILPPVPAFYNHPKTIDDVVNHIVMRILDQFDIHLDLLNRWDGMLTNRRSAALKDEPREDTVTPARD